jgi:hypothetical protein
MSDDLIYIYCSVSNEFSWEDLVIFINKESAIEYSLLKPNFRIEIFSKDLRSNGEFLPTYNFYKNGILYMT